MLSRLIWTTLFAGLLFAPLGTMHSAGSAPMPRPPVLAWSFDIHDDRDGSPHGQVFLRVNGRNILVVPKADMQYTVVPRSEYHERGVPAAALTACSGWWAGAGMGLYVIPHRGRLDIFRRDEDEQSGNSAYRLIKSLPLPRQ